MLDYRDELEEIRKGLDYQYYFDEAPGLNKMEVPASFASLDKKFERLQDLPLSEKVETGKDLLAQMVGKAIDHKLTIAQKVYPKLQELTTFYYEKWMVPVVFPLQKKEKEEIERLKARAKARKNGIKPDKSPEELLHDLVYEHDQEEKKRRERFMKFYDLLYSKKNLIKEVKDSIREKNLSFSWWIYKRTNELLEAVAQHKKDENSDIDKAHIVDLLGFTTMAKSLYWNVKIVEEKLENIRVKLFGISDDLFLWATKDFIESCKKEGKQAIADINYSLEDMYSKHIHARFDFYRNALMVWDAEQMLARELKTVEPIVSLPDKIREKIQKWMNEAERKEAQNNKLLSVQDLAVYYDRSEKTVTRWLNDMGIKTGMATISKVDKYLANRKSKRRINAKKRKPQKNFNK